MNKIQAAHNVVKTAVTSALAEANGRKGRISHEDQEHAKRIVEAIDRLIDVKMSGTGDEEYERA
ncbi:hypothetical protein [Microbacterium sp. EST19A]|uniref:hypothetical protein n=1 Tax=Microbacterium sp. EST19A TaxID=2862681 RepID=UPI001CBEFFD3|nr:hypothetical protein [Microbacterium sp. EST19A]